VGAACSVGRRMMAAGRGESHAAEMNENAGWQRSLKE
jgi:hypothetical protein